MGTPSCAWEDCEEMQSLDLSYSHSHLQMNHSKVFQRSSVVFLGTLEHTSGMLAQSVPWVHRAALAVAVF